MYRVSGASDEEMTCFMVTWRGEPAGLMTQPFMDLTLVSKASAVTRLRAASTPPGRRTRVARRNVVVRMPLESMAVNCSLSSTTASVSAGSAGRGRAASATSHWGGLSAPVAGETAAMSAKNAAKTANLFMSVPFLSPNLRLG